MLEFDSLLYLALLLLHILVFLSLTRSYLDYMGRVASYQVAALTIVLLSLFGVKQKLSIPVTE